MGVGFEPFCVAWTDIYTDESGFRIVVAVDNHRTTYNAPPDANEYFPPPASSPTSLRGLSVMVFVQRPGGEEQVRSFAVGGNP
jgi:hypothetical protein